MRWKHGAVTVCWRSRFEHCSLKLLAQDKATVSHQVACYQRRLTGPENRKAFLIMLDIEIPHSFPKETSVFLLREHGAESRNKRERSKACCSVFVLD